MDDIWPVGAIRATAAGIVLRPAVEADRPLWLRSCRTTTSSTHRTVASASWVGIIR